MADKAETMADPAVADPVASPAPAKPKNYRCPNASYTIPEIMCIGRQQNGFHLCPKCSCRAALPQAAVAPSNPN